MTTANSATVGVRPSFLDQGGRGMAQLQVQLLHPPAGPHRPSLVSEVPFELADDGAGGEGGEIDAQPGRLKRSTDFTRASEATCTRSSNSSPRCRKRRASWCARPRFSVIIASRSPPRTGSSVPPDPPPVPWRPCGVPSPRGSVTPKGPRLRLRSQARTDPSSSSRPGLLVDQRGEDLLAELVGPVAAAPGASVAGPAPSQRAGDVERHRLSRRISTRNSPWWASLPCSASRDSFSHRQAEVLEFLDIEPGAGRDGRRHQAGQHHQVAAGGKRQLHPVAHAQGVEPDHLAVRSFIGHPWPGHGLDDGEHGGQAGDLEDLHDPLVRHHQLQLASLFAAPLERADQHAERGRVEEGHGQEVDHQGGPALGDQGAQAFLQLRCGGDVDLPGHRHHLTLSRSVRSVIWKGCSMAPRFSSVSTSGVAFARSSPWVGDSQLQDLLPLDPST